MADPVISFTFKARQMHEAMGDALTQWAWVEDGLVKMLARILGCSLEQAGIVWYSVVSFNGKLEMIDSLVGHSPLTAPMQEWWPSCFDYLRTLCSCRNRIAHWELVSLNPKGGSTWPFDAKSEARLVPHAFDAREKMSKHRDSAGICAEDVKFYGSQFSWIGSDLRDAALAMGGAIPWPDKFSRPLERPRNRDDLWPLNPKGR